MGCLNPGQGFSHWFANIHFSGPCNRACYFCIGQHMMALDALNNLNTFPLQGFDLFVHRCRENGVSEVNLTGSNTDPLLYRHIARLKDALLEHIPNLVFGVRTNGVRVLRDLSTWKLFDKGSISLPSFDPEVYRAMMGPGSVPDLERILHVSEGMPLKVNVVLGPQNVGSGDLWRTLDRLDALGVRRVNLREPYGQPHIGDPLRERLAPSGTRLGMPVYRYGNLEVVWWDVHFVEVESVNLYANGEVSVLYPVTAGHCPQTGKVEGQEHFVRSGRIREQWVQLKKPPTRAA